MNFNASTTSVNYWVKQSANAIYFNFSFRSVSWPMSTCWLELNRRLRHSEILDEKGLKTKWRKDKVGTEKNRHLESNRTLFSFREGRSKELRGTRFLKSNRWTNKSQALCNLLQSYQNAIRMRAAISLAACKLASKTCWLLRWGTSATKSLSPWQQIFWSFLYLDIASLES